MNETIRKDLNQLREMVNQMGKSGDLPAEPKWLHRNFPNDWHGIEIALNVITSTDYLNDIYDGIQDIMLSSRDQTLVDYDLIHEHAQQGQIVNDIIDHADPPLDSYYFDDEIQLDPDSDPIITYQELAYRAKDYLDISECEDEQ